MPDPWNKLSQKDAERKLDKIQFGREPVAMRLMGAKVSVAPEPGNMFRISLDMSVPRAKTAARRLNDIGADVKPWPCPATGLVQALVTWDSALHYLAMTGDLA